MYMKNEKIFEAIKFAVDAHSGQFRKGTEIPYIIHPLGVAKILIENGCSEEVVITGILHDTVEDTTVTLDDIKKHFGERIVKFVEALSELNKEESWESRKKHTINNLKTAPMEVLLVTCADKLDNLEAIQEDYNRYGETVWSRFNRPKSKQAWYYQSIAEILVSRIQDDLSKSFFTKYQSEAKRVFGS